MAGKRREIISPDYGGAEMRAEERCCRYSFAESVRFAAQEVPNDFAPPAFLSPSRIYERNFDDGGQL